MGAPLSSFRGLADVSRQNESTQIRFELQSGSIVFLLPFEFLWKNLHENFRLLL
jgi:hypothetical protein